MVTRVLLALLFLGSFLAAIALLAMSKSAIHEGLAGLAAIFCLISFVGSSLIHHQHLHYQRLEQQTKLLENIASNLFDLSEVHKGHIRDDSQTVLMKIANSHVAAVKANTERTNELIAWLGEIQQSDRP
jgi:hypothetical protein